MDDITVITVIGNPHCVGVGLGLEIGLICRSIRLGLGLEIGLVFRLMRLWLGLEVGLIFRSIHRVKDRNPIMQY